MAPTLVGILIFDEVEVLDFCGPFEVFTAARASDDFRREQPPLFRPLLVAEELREIVTTGGMCVRPHHSFADCPPLEVLLVPGGWGTRREVGNRRVVEWIARTGAAVPVLASVCTGTFLLAAAGLLDGRRVTTHWRSLDRLARTHPGRMTVVRDEHVVRDGHVLTSAGVSAGLELALRVVADRHGERIARETAAWLEHPYPETNSRRV